MNVVKMQDVSKQIRGVSYKPTDLHESLNSSSVILLRANNIEDGKINFDDVVYVDKSKVSTDQYLKKGDILICASSGSKQLVGKAASFDFDKECTFGAFCKVLRPDENVADYIGKYFQSDKYRSIISNVAIGANINNIRNEHIDSLEVPMYSPEKTDEIVRLISKVQLIIEYRKQELSNLDDLIKSRFVEMFGDLKTNPKNWQQKNLLEVAKIDTTMVKDYGKYADYPHIGIDSIEKNTGRLFGFRTVSEDNVISGKYLFTDKHIIYSKIRPNLNKVALPDFEGLCSADAYPILADEKRCLRLYLGYVMRSEYFLDYILPFSRRANMPKVNKEQLSGFCFPLPDIQVQKQFATFVEHIDKLKVKVQQSLDETQILMDSLMQKYFG